MTCSSLSASFRVASSPSLAARTPVSFLLPPSDVHHEIVSFGSVGLWETDGLFSGPTSAQPTSSHLQWLWSSLRLVWVCPHRPSVSVQVSISRSLTRSQWFAFSPVQHPRELVSFDHLTSNFSTIHSSYSSKCPVSIHRGVAFSCSCLCCWELARLDASADQVTASLRSNICDSASDIASALTVTLLSRLLLVTRSSVLRVACW